MRLFQHTNIQFVKYRYIFYAISLVVIIAGIAGLFTKGLNWSIDFTSGITTQINLKPLGAAEREALRTKLEYTTPVIQDSLVSDSSMIADTVIPKVVDIPTGELAPVKIDQLRSVLRSNGFPDAEIQYVDDPADATFMVKIKQTESDTDGGMDDRQKLVTVLQENFGPYIVGRTIADDVIRDFFVVGPKVGGEMRTDAIKAVFIALLLIIIYVWVRFEFTFGLMAVLAVFHDVICIVGIFALTGKEISIQIVAALLTIVGYSINDTIVIFDRIREDLKQNRKEPYEKVFNAAINRTLGRTTLTGGTTLLTAFALLFFGGSVLHDFAFAITLGVLFGSYSSIFIASNLVVETFHLIHKEKKSIQKLTKKK
ncbi:MAG: protein translocase subunit SecF [Candidatus Cloacimonetes bacterium]|nr:protein translocase subunit SecF [Candidatus Cloacimonadota bacterium]